MGADYAEETSQENDTGVSMTWGVRELNIIIVSSGDDLDEFSGYLVMGRTIGLPLLKTPGDQISPRTQRYGQDMGKL